MAKQSLTNVITNKTDVQELLTRLAQLGSLKPEGRDQEGVIDGDNKPSLQLLPVSEQPVLF